jgi:hypothetical protein
MNAIASLNPITVLIATAAAFAWGGLYWAAIAPSFARALRLDPEPRWPGPALVIAFLTRLVQAFGVALILGFAGVETVGAGAIAGAVLCCLVLLPFMVGQAAFGTGSSWRRLLVATPGVLIDITIIGAIVVL